MFTHEQQTQVHHIAQLALAGMCVRAVAASEFENTEVCEVLFRVSRVEGIESPVDVEFIGASSVQLGGMSI